MESLGAFMMVAAMMWPIAGGAVIGLIGGLLRGHGLVGAVIDAVLGGIVGYGLIMAFMVLSPKLALPDALTVPLTLGLPVLGGLIGLGIGGRFSRG